MQKKLVAVASMALAALLSGCGTAPKNTTVHRINDGVSVLSYDATRRGVFVSDKSAKHIVCAEPVPEVTLNYDNSLGFGGQIGASGNAVVDPLLGTAGAVGGLLTQNTVKNLLTSLRTKDGKGLDLSKLLPGELGRITAQINAGFNFHRRDSMTTEQLVVSDAIKTLRAIFFWECINQANFANRSEEDLKVAQEQLKDLTSSVILQQLDIQKKQAEATLARAHAAGSGTELAAAGGPKSSGKGDPTLESLLSSPDDDVKQAAKDALLSQLRAKSASSKADAEVQAQREEVASSGKRDQALLLSRQAYAAFIADRLDVASSLFKRVETVYPKFQSAFEMYRAIDGAPKGPNRQCAVVQTILKNKIFYGMTPSERAEVEKRRNCTK